MGEPGIALWRELFALAERIRMLAPWTVLKPDSIIEVELDGTRWSCAFFTDATGLCLSCLRGEEGLVNYLEMLGAAPTDMMPQVMEQDALNLFFLPRRALASGDNALVEAMGMHQFSGRFPCYRAYAPGYVPWPLNEEEAALLLRLHGQVLAALETLTGGEVQVCFERGQMLRRRYDAGTDAWVSEAAPFVRPKRAAHVAHLHDDLLAPRMLKRSLVDARLEMDVFRVPTPVTDEAYSKPFFPTMAILADSGSGQIAGFEVFTPEDSEDEKVIDLLVRFMERYGRPLILYLQNPRVRTLVSELCERIMLPTELLNFLPAINAFKLKKGIAESRQPDTTE